jgi:CBS domain-containing protein
MQKLQEKLNSIAQQLKKGVTQERITVREILGWLNVSRRGSNVNWWVRRALEEAGLETQPDFEWAYIDGPIKFVAIGSNEDQEAVSTTYRIDGLESANRKPVSVKPDSALTEAITVMLTNDFSQLPVMTTEREVKGAISWKSIGSRLALGKKCTLVRECMDPAQVISAESSLFEAIRIIAEHDYVLVQAQDRTICGIVTASDLSQQFSNLAEPFLLIGECENLIGRLIHGKFRVGELEDAKNASDPSRTVAGVADLTLGEYVRLLEDESRWSRLKLSVDRREFIDRLNRVREIRNDVMHFDPQGVDPEAMKALREFVRFLQELRRLGVT